MIFGNNMEAMASEKSGWAIIDQSADGSVIYMGKPVSDSVKLSDNAWLIKKITTTTNEDSSQIIKTQYAEPRYKCSWNERKELEYMPKLEGEPEQHPEQVKPRILQFTVGFYNYEAGLDDAPYEVWTFDYEEGMTWQDFICSDYGCDYNTGGWFEYDGHPAGDIYFTLYSESMDDEILPIEYKGSLS